MSVNTTALATAMLAAIDAEDPKEIGETMDQYRLRIKTAEIAAMWTYISANAIVTVTGVTGVTTGGGTSGPGGGTIA